MYLFCGNLLIINVLVCGYLLIKKRVLCGYLLIKKIFIARISIIIMRMLLEIDYYLDIYNKVFIVLICINKRKNCMRINVN